MATAPTQIRIDADIKQDAAALFARLGLDMSGAVNIFLHQCILRGGLPFSVELPQYNRREPEATAKTRRKKCNPDSAETTDVNEQIA